MKIFYKKPETQETKDKPSTPAQKNEDDFELNDKQTYLFLLMKNK